MDGRPLATSTRHGLILERTMQGQQLAEAEERQAGQLGHPRVGMPEAGTPQGPEARAPRPQAAPTMPALCHSSRTHSRQCL